VVVGSFDQQPKPEDKTPPPKKTADKSAHEPLGGASPSPSPA
jgi:hypothetical protein